MTMNRLKLLIAATVSVLLPALAPFSVTAAPIGVIVPYFEGEGWLARNVPAVLNLQIWRTLRRAPYPNPKNLNFGDGIVMWAETPLAKPGHRDAEDLAKECEVQMTLWGNAITYGDGIVVQPYLSIPRYEDGRSPRNELWTVSIPIGGKEYRVEADIPARSYEFAPIVLSRSVVERYSSPGALKIYREKALKTEVGTVGDAFEAMQHDGDKVQVVADGKTGWVHIPSLSAQRNEVVDFTGGLVRIYRGDWNGAIDLMKRVAQDESTPTSIKVDAYLYQAFAQVRLGKNPGDALRKARVLSPNSGSVAVFEVMHLLENLRKEVRKHPREKERHLEAKRVANEIRAMLERSRYLFPGKDRWVGSVDALTQQIR